MGLFSKGKDKAVFNTGDRKLIEDATKELIANPTKALDIYKKYTKKILETTPNKEVKK